MRDSVKILLGLFAPRCVPPQVPPCASFQLCLCKSVLQKWPSKSVNLLRSGSGFFLPRSAHFQIWKQPVRDVKKRVSNNSLDCQTTTDQRRVMLKGHPRWIHCR